MATGTFALIMDGKGKLADFANLSPAVQKSAQIALNDAIRRTRTQSAKRVREQVNFPASYVSPSSGRLSVTGYAKPGNLEARITAKKRSTSLARFVTSGSAKKAGVRVEVKPGVARFLKGAFFVKLRQGSELTDTKQNRGLAIRLPRGKKPSSAYKPVQLSNGMWLLYGPSVAQALLSASETGIWPNMDEEVMDYLEDQFLRQLDLRDGK